MFKEIKAAQNVLGLLAELQKIDTDGDGVADLAEYKEMAVAVIPEVLSAKANLDALLKDLEDIKRITGDKFDLLMGNLAYVQSKLGR